MSRNGASVLRVLLFFILLAGLIFQPQAIVYAAANLTITPLTWNVIGLDSNNVNVGPNHFPVGARACNTGDATATNLNAVFVWDSANAFINLRPGTLTSISASSLAAGSCTDFYFEVEVTRNAAAYDTTRNYHITVTADGGISVSTPTPRTLYVEHLVSQNRNAVTDVQYGTSLASLTSVASGGTMTLLVGNTYYIRLVGFTATQGYEQLESFINIPNTIFQVNSVITTYTADTSATVSSPNNKAYGDACVWENDPNSPNYRACLSTGKVGGNITVTYQVTILQAPSAPLVNPQPLSTLIYDFSGSSYHYNSDYGVSTRYAFVLDPSTLTIAKNFSPDPTNVGGISTLTFTITNPNAVSVSGLNFTDPLPTTPGAMTIANPTNASTSGCGSPTFAPVAGATSISFSNGTVAANSTCTIKLNVTVPATGTYTNTSNHLFIDTLDTGNIATDPLTVNSAPATPSPVCGLSIAQWTFPTGFNTASPAPSSGSGTATPGGGIVAASFTEGTDSWGSNGAIDTTGALTTTNNDFIQFAITTTGYSSVSLTFDAARKNIPNSPRGIAVYYSAGTVNNPEPNAALYSNATALPTGTTAFSSFGSFSFTPTATTMYVRIYFFNAGNTASGSDIFVDNVTFTGCAVPNPPTLTKTFSPNPIAVNGVSTLTFTLSNSNSIALTGVTFTDALPSGLQVAATPSAATTCGGTPTWAPSAGATNLTFGSPTGASIPANSSCTVSVNITGAASGQYQNVSGFISSTNGGTNTGSTGSATATLTVLKPPVISKLFAPNPIIINGTSTLTFTLTNPNLNNALTGVAFSDTYPAGLTNTNPLSTSNSCGGTLTVAAGGGSISLGGGTISAGSSCTVTTTVTAAVANSYANTTGTVSSTNGGTGNSASDTLTVNSPNPAIALLKQVSTGPTGPWTNYLIVAPGMNVYYQFTVENIGDVPLSPISVSDPEVSAAGCTWPGTLQVADANDNDHIATCVVGPIVSVTGENTNTATASGTYGGTPYTSTASSATYSTPEITLVKTALDTSFMAVNDQLDYEYLVTNSGFAPLLGPVTVADDKVTVTCPAVSTVGDLDNYFDPGESLTCTATYTVQATDVTAGFVTNTASASADDVTSNTDSETVYILRPDLTVTKTNNASGSVAQNGSFNWTITVTNSGIASAAFTNGAVIMSDTLPGLSTYYPQGDLLAVNGTTPPTGSVYCSITGTALSCVASGAVTLPAGASFSVTFAVTPSAAGSLANTATVDLNGVITEINETNNTSSDTVTVVASPSIAKSFSPNPIVAGGTSTLTFTLTNSNTSTALSGVAFSDTYPTGMTNNTPLTTSNTCGGSLTAAAGGGSISLSGGAIAANGSCTITVVITTSTSGSNVNTSGSVSSTNGGTGNTASSTLTVFDAQPSKSLVTTSEAFTGFVSPTERVAIGEMIRYRLATRLPQGSFTNVQLLDGIPTGLQFLNDGTAMVAFVCNSSVSCMTSSTLAGAGLVVNGSTSTVSPTFVIPGAAISGGPFGSGTDVTFSMGNITNSDVDADSEYVVVEFNALVLNVNATATINQGIDNQTGANVSNNRQNDVTLRINGATVGSASPNVTVAVAEPAITSITKSVAPAGPYRAGDALTYTLSFSNNATGSNATTAFDIVLTDTFNANLTIGTVNVSSDQGTTCAGGNIFSTGNTTVGQLVTVTVTCLDPGRTVTITVNTTISASIAAGTTISNSSSLTYTSLPGTQGHCATSPFTCTSLGSSGSGTGERNGSGGPGADASVLNNYAVTSNTVNSTVTFGSITITKDAVPNNAQDFAFTGTGPSFTGNFNLDDDADGTLGNSVSFGNLLPGSYSFTETSVTGWSLTGLTCTDPDGGSSTNIGTATASIDLDSGESIVCTYTNTQWAPAIILTKTPALNNAVVAPSGETNAGDTITYTFSVQNTGNVTITNIIVTDPLLPTLSCTIASLAPGATSSCTATNNVYTLTQADVDAGARANTATVTGQDPGNNDVTDSDTKTVTLSLNPALTIQKSVTETSYANVGDVLHYSYLVTNSGNVTLSDPFTVTDDKSTDEACPATPTLAPGASITCTATYTVTLADIVNGFVTNLARAQGYFINDIVLSEFDDETVMLASNPSFNITKSANVFDVDAAGDIITYTITLTNTGNVALTGIVVSDPLLANLDCDGVAGLPYTTTGLSIAVNGVLTCMGTYTVTQTDLDTNGGGDGLINNTVTGDTNETSSQTAIEIVEIVQDPAHITLKTETSVGPYGLSDTITYDIVVTNTGNITLTDVAISDNSATLGTCTPAQPASLAPGDTLTCPATHVVTQADLDSGSYVNTATGESDQTPPAISTVTVTFSQTPALTIVKSVTETSYANVGDVLHYSYLVTNSGDVTLSGPFTVTDDKSTDEVCPLTATLAPGANITCSATYTITALDILNGSVTNIAAAHGFFGGSPVDSTTDTETVNLAAAPAMILTKTPTLDDGVVAPSGVANVGDTITYAFSVENTGNVTLTNITVTDPLLPTLTCTIASLGPGATSSCAATNNVYTLTQADINSGARANTATATGTDPGNNPVTDTDTKTTTLTQSPSIVLTKTPVLDDTVVAPSGVANVGDTITYAFSVENTGNVTITNIVVTDPLLPTLSCTIPSLAPGASAGCVATNNVYTLTQTDINAGSRANTATATGKDPNNVDVSDTDTQTTTLTQAPSLTIVKEVSVDNSTWNDTSVTVTVGDTVYYRIRVENTGNIPLTGLSVDDGMVGCALVRGTDLTGDNDSDFEVGEEWVYTCSVTSVLGTHNNIATAITNETQQESDAAAYTAVAVLVADPALSKAGSPTQAVVGETVTFTITVTNAGNAPAANVVITDPLPAMFDVTKVTVTGAPIGTSVNVTPPIGTGPAPYTVVVTLGGNLGVSDIVTIQIVTTVNGLGNPPITNNARLTTSSTSDVTTNNTDSVAINIRAASLDALPATGFAMNTVTVLPSQPAELLYSATDLTLEIPSLGVKLPIVGIPKKNGMWDVTWLSNQAGWLEGTAFPSWKGNSVLTSHVYLSNGLPGPFVNLSKLKYGDQLIVHAYGQKYIFEVRTNQVVLPSDTTAFKHEEKSWLTLITCMEYDEKTRAYRKRVIVRAVLVSIEWGR